MKEEQDMGQARRREMMMKPKEKRFIYLMHKISKRSEQEIVRFAKIRFK